MNSEEGYVVNIGQHKIYVSGAQARGALAIALSISTLLFVVFLWFYLSPLYRGRVVAGPRKSTADKIVSTGSWVNRRNHTTQVIRLLDAAKDVEGGDCGCNDINCCEETCLGKDSSARKSIPIIVTILPPGLSPPGLEKPGDVDASEQWDLDDTKLHPPTVKARNVADAISHPSAAAHPAGIKAHIVNPSAHRKSFFAQGGGFTHVVFPGTSERDHTSNEDDKGQPPKTG